MFIVRLQSESALVLWKSNLSVVVKDAAGIAAPLMGNTVTLTASLQQLILIGTRLFCHVNQSHAVGNV